MARRGRPTKYTEAAVKRLCDAIGQGATYEHAAAAAGIHYDTFNEWRKQYPEFSEMIKAAEGVAVVRWLSAIDVAAASGQWQAAAWKLERRYPHMYGRTIQEQTGQQKLIVEVIERWREPVGATVIEQPLAEEAATNGQRPLLH